MKKILSVVACLLLGTAAFAQQNLMGTAVELRSPDIKDDNSVTFRVYAPKAITVRLTGDFLPHHIADNNGYVTEVPIWVDMKEGKDGIWEYTTEPLAPELYSYMFRIDGLPFTDPSNQFRHRDMTVWTNYFLISAEEGDIEKLAPLFAKKPEYYLVACGKADPIARFSFEFADALKEKGYPHETLWTDGAHTWKNWRNYLMIFVERLFK